jgi:hypothetical protein
MAIESGDRKRGEQQMGGVSPGNFWELRTAIPSFEQVAAFIGGGYSFTEHPILRPCRAYCHFQLLQRAWGEACSRSADRSRGHLRSVPSSHGPQLSVVAKAFWW